MKTKFNFKSFFVGILVSSTIMLVSIPIIASSNTVQAVYSNIKIKVDGETVKFAQGEEPVTINNRTYVPAKYVAEALDATVTWDGKNSTVNIASTEPSTTTTTNSTTNNTGEEVSDTNTTTSTDTNSISATPSVVDNKKTPIEPNKEYFPEGNQLERTTDGILLCYINEKPYVKVVRFNNFYARKSTNYYLNYNLSTNILDLTIKIGDNEYKKILEDIQYLNIESGVIYVDYNFYINTILPLISK
jgi:hypothetical protein